MTSGAKPISVSAAAAPTSNDMVTVELNLKPQHPSGLVFAGKPPRLTSLDAALIKLPPGQASILDYYFEALIVPGVVELFQAASHETVHQALVQYQDEPRQVLLSSHPPSGALLENVSCMYKYDLPAAATGLEFAKFPPTVSRVDPASPLNGKAQVGQYVESVLFGSGGSDLNGDMPGFTAMAIARRLQETNHLTGRQLVLKDLTALGVQRTVKTKHDESTGSERAPFDWKGCCCM